MTFKNLNEIAKKVLMSKEIELCRRENGLAIRYLAQCIFNDLVFPDQLGIHKLMEKAINNSSCHLSVDPVSRWEYWFLFHMEDFDTGDKSEIDLLLRKDKILFLIEIKAFTNPNATDVKREIVRNCINLKLTSRNEDKFSPVDQIIPVLLYSKPMHLETNHSAKDYDYFNKRYLFTKDYRQRGEITVWSSSHVKSLHDSKMSLKIAKEMSQKMLFITWDDVLNTIIEFDEIDRFKGIIRELRERKDQTRKINLVSNIYNGYC